LEVRLISSTSSPDKSLIADYYELTGGGAAGVAVDRVRLRATAGAFESDDGFSFEALSADPVSVRWLSDRELEIAYNKAGTVRRDDSHWNNVSIQYRTIGRGSMLTDPPVPSLLPGASDATEHNAKTGSK